jgi:hypothetical protein
LLAHSIEKNPDKVLELAHTIVHGDLSKQDSVVDELSVLLFDIVDWSIVLDGAEALELCDELAESIYEEPKEQFGPLMKKEKERHLRLVKICVDCHKGKGFASKVNHTIAWSNNDFLRLRCVDDLLVSFNTSLDYS